MRHFKVFGSLVVLMLVTSGCMIINRTIPCAEFDNDIVDWLPYKNGDVIQLRNTVTDSIISLPVHDFSVQHTTSYQTMADCGYCWDNVYINSENGEDPELLVDIFLDANVVESQSYEIQSSRFDDYYSSYQELENYSFEGITYSEVKVFENEESDDRFVKLILAKDFGIVGLVDQEGNSWELMDHSFLERPEQSVTIHSIAC